MRETLSLYLGWLFLFGELLFSAGAGIVIVCRGRLKNAGAAGQRQCRIGRIVLCGALVLGAVSLVEMWIVRGSLGEMIETLLNTLRSWGTWGLWWDVYWNYSGAAIIWLVVIFTNVILALTAAAAGAVVSAAEMRDSRDAAIKGMGLFGLIMVLAGAVLLMIPKALVWTVVFLSFVVITAGGSILFLCWGKLKHLQSAEREMNRMIKGAICGGAVFLALWPISSRWGGLRYCGLIEGWIMFWYCRDLCRDLMVSVAAAAVVSLTIVLIGKRTEKESTMKGFRVLGAAGMLSGGVMFLAALFGLHFICQLHWQVINVALLMTGAAVAQIGREKQAASHKAGSRAYRRAKTALFASLASVIVSMAYNWRIVRCVLIRQTSSIYIGPSLLITQFAAIAAAVSLTALVAARIKPAPGDA